MDFKTQMTGLDELLSAIYGSESGISTLLPGLGFEKAQTDRLKGEYLQVLVSDFLEAIHQRLTSESGIDTYYQILRRRYGLDGDPAESLDSIAQSRNTSREQLGQLFQEIMEKCRTKAVQNDFKKGLKQIAVAQLSKMGEKPTREHMAGKLERLTNLRGAADVARLDYESKRADILKKVQAELGALDLEYKPLLDSVQENIEELENEIKTDVLLHGESVSGGGYRAVFTKGRVSWDNKGIENYAERHPEVLQFRKQSAPSVSLRAVGEKD